MILRLTPLLLALICFLSVKAFVYQDSLLNVVNNSAKSNRANKAGALIELSKFYWTNNTDSAISMSHSVISIGEELDNPKIIGDGYFNLGMIEYVNGSFANGYSSFIKSSEFYNEANDVLLTAQSLYQSGVCLRKIDQLGDGISVIKKGYELIIETHHYQLAFSMSKELGEMYALSKDSISAEKYFKEALKISNFHGDTSATIQTNISMGCFYQEISEHKKSLNSFHNALKLVHPKNKHLLAQIYNLIGESLLLDNQLQEATNYFNLGLVTAKEGGSKLAQSRSHFNLSKIYELQQKYALALIEFKLFNQINDSINTVLKTQSISELQAKFDNVNMSKELHFKDLQVEKSEIEMLESQIEVQNQSFQKKVIIGSLVIVLFFGLVLLYAFRKQRHLNIKLDQLSIVAKEIENTVIIADQNGDVEWVNDSYSRKYGLDLNGFKKEYGDNILDNPYNQKIKSKIDQAIAEKKTVQYFLTNVDINGNEKNLRTTLTPTLDEDGNIKKLILIDTEITDLIQAERQITTARDELQNIYTQVSESIDYALRIQEAVLPHPTKINKFFKEYYLLYKPKDVVSGDFYFVEETEKYIYFAGADCTGHGVPGALMSVICHNLLENAVHRGMENTNEILVELNDQIIKKLRQSTNADDHIKDGLDIALCRLSKNEKGERKRKLQYSGAHSAIYIVDNNQLTEIKPDRIHLGMPIKKDKSITLNELTVSEGSEIIIFSDGFADQKGFKTGKKYYYEPFRNLVLKTSQLDSNKKAKHLQDEFDSWKGSLMQADDVFVWGLKI